MYSKLGLNYEQLDKRILESIVFLDGSFNGNNDGSSQVGFTILELTKKNTHHLLTSSTSNHEESTIGIRCRNIWISRDM